MMFRMDDDEISAAFKAAQSHLQRHRNELSKVPAPVATFLRVYGAQGVIDNGGYRYFFEADWPDTPDYSVFVEAYRSIGCRSQAKDLARVVKTFPFSRPHLRVEKRNEFIRENYDARKFHVRGWGNALCGDESVWSALARFVRKHKKVFTSSVEKPKPTTLRLLRDE
jgi:hypothetical protein